jgi:plasmid stabilization system protein ParE
MGQPQGGTGTTLPVAQPVIFTQAARLEVIDAQDWYEAQASGLGVRFRAELDLAVQRISDNALQFPIVLRDVRRARLHRFPHYLLFRVDLDAVTVIACFHPRRDPQQWQRRIGH